MSGAASHLVHGMGMAMEAPTWPAITMADAEAALAHFLAAGRLIGLDWHSPRPFSAATLARTDGGEYFLKRHHKSLRTPAALAEEHGFMAHLRAGGVAVPEVLEAASGASAIGLGDWSYELHRKAPGVDLYRDRQSWTPFLTHDHGYAAGAALARLHGAARDFTAPPRGPHPLVSSFTILPARDPLGATQAYMAPRPAVADFLADQPWRQELADLFGALGEGLSDRLEGQPSLWTHNDWHPTNLLWSDDGTVSSIFDFGLATQTCALHDIATAIERCAIPWLELEGGIWRGVADADAALSILAGYRSVLPLGRDDLETIIRLLPLVHIEFALSEVDYFAGILTDRDAAMIAWKDYLIDHARWFLSLPGQAFLAELRRGALA
ncbi:Ser/Thr protein kinase RdoA involved in Cpx stress response, MazF antagonist [Sphingobium sp. AP50]|uniref:phosphotransferase enzyme family protein n=1 Tax=Sphingobium sp. AP50 TaxID=1884369 RepID=UPI0008BE2FEF|nr:phosphotransferase [Sphingobium sp. AP50]SEJ14965.1 Ser/Thr protein kinase RdoA involved in Cpx stress response, MazF antagonist [Sphingobium sp. AP50]